MKIDGTQITRTSVQVDVSGEAVWNSLMQAILSQWNISPEWFLRDEPGGKVFKADIGRNLEDVMIANPSESQIEVYQLIQRLKIFIDFQKLRSN